MANLDLRVDYQDDILDASVNTQRKYNIIENADGTKTLEDVSVYTQVGDTFGAVDINKTNQAVLDLNQSLTLDYSNASADVQNINILLQKLLDKFYPKLFNFITDTNNTWWGGNIDTIAYNGSTIVMKDTGLDNSIKEFYAYKRLKI